MWGWVPRHGCLRPSAPLPKLDPCGGMMSGDIAEHQPLADRSTRAERTVTERVRSIIPGRIELVYDDAVLLEHPTHSVCGEASARAQIRQYHFHGVERTVVQRSQGRVGAVRRIAVVPVVGAGTPMEVIVDAG